MADASSPPSTSPGGDERARVAAAQADPWYFNSLYQEHEPGIYRYLLSRTGNEEEAADLTQQVFLRALESLPKYRERGLPFAAWLFRIAHNLVVDTRRRRRDIVTWDRLPESRHPASSEGPETEVLRREDAETLRQLLSELEPERREMILLRFVARLSQKEIGLVVGKSEEAVRKQLTRTLQSMKEQYLAQG